MDLTLSAEHEAFRAEVRAWLRDNVPSPPLPPPGTPESFAQHVAWERRLSEAGYSAIHWPVEYGGKGADVLMHAIFEEEYLLAGGPERVTVVGTNLMGPTLMVHGTDEQKQRWLPGILDASVIWSQGFSEPDAGSDLASLRTKAERDGDHFVVNGQKIWTSYGPYADWIFALVRTNPDVKKYAGITFLAFPMDTPGVEVRPITQLDGHAGFAEVFFTDVRVPVENVVGEVDDGWAVTMTTLAVERDSPAAAPARYHRDLTELVRVARRRRLDDDPVVLDRLADLFVTTRVYDAHATRTLSTLYNGGSLGAEASVTKVLWSELERDLFEEGLELLGPHGEVLDDAAPLSAWEDWHSKYWYARAATIYAGTSEVQRNILAQRVLGLPRG